MPTHFGKDSKGCYAQWGKQKKYYYACGNKQARARAKSKADKQGAAIRSTGWKENSAEGKPMKNLYRVVLNLEPLVRNDTMEGRDYVVCPAVILLEGVHSGSYGPIYYPEEEIRKTPEVWNHKPVVVYHPDAPTACDPDILTNRKIGVMMNTKWDGKLRTEVWLEEDRVKKVDNRIWEAVENKEMMELSTGLFGDLDNMKGEWNGEEYDGILRNYRPDHLAILPDQVGACSMEDGAGFMCVNAENKELRISQSFADSLFPVLQAAGIDTSKLVHMEMGHDEIRRQLADAVSIADTFAWVEEVYSDYFIYDLDGKLFKQSYEVKEDKVSLNGISEPVVRVVTYEAVKNKKTLKGVKMKEMIAFLINSKFTGFTKDDQELLENQDEAVLKRWKADAEYLEQEAVANEEKEEPKEEPVENEKEDQKPMTLNEYLDSTPAEFRSMVTEGIKTHNAEKAKCIETIMASPKNGYTKEMLDGKELSELRILANMLKKEETKTEAYDFSGMADPVSNSDMEEPLGLPVMNFEN